MRKAVLAMMAVVGIMLLSSSAFAGTIGPSCGSCFGSTYTLTYSYVSQGVTVASTNSDVVDVTLTIDASGYNGSGSLLDAVAVKVSSSLVGGTNANTYNYLTSAPGGTGNWTVDAGGLSAGGCNGNGGGFDCAQAVATHAIAVPTNTTLTWVFNLTIPHGSLMLGSLPNCTGNNGCASIKAEYTLANGKQAGLVSEDITLTQSPPKVPEPGTMALLGSGLLGLGGIVRRRF